MEFEKLSHQFEEELKDKMMRAKKECKYNPTRFNQMLARYGGVATAKQLIENSPQFTINRFTSYPAPSIS